MTSGKDFKTKIAVAEPSVMHLSTLINYQHGAVVSKEILKKNTGNITLFAFDKGQGLSEHTAPFDAMVFILEGEVEISISRKPYRLISGDMIVMPAGQPHSLKALTQYKMILVMIRS